MYSSGGGLMPSMSGAYSSGGGLNRQMTYAPPMPQMNMGYGGYPVNPQIQTYLQPQYTMPQQAPAYNTLNRIQTMPAYPQQPMYPAQPVQPVMAPQQPVMAQQQPVMAPVSNPVPFQPVQPALRSVRTLPVQSPPMMNPPVAAPIQPVATMAPQMGAPMAPAAAIGMNGPMGLQNGVFNPENDCQILRNAMHGAGTDEQTIINLICSRNADQRAQIRKTYMACYGKDLIQRLRDDLSGNFEDCCCGLFMTHAEYDAYCLYKAMKGLGTNEGVLIEIIGTRNNFELTEVKQVYERTYGKSLEKWVSSETSFNFKKMLMALLQCNRSMNANPNPTQCQTDAQALYSAGEGRLGTDEATFIRILSQRSAAEIAMINQCYHQLRGKSLMQAIESEFSGDIKKLLLTVVNGLLDIHAYFAVRVREAVQGLGTCDAKLVRVIVSRCEIDMPQIKQAYQRIYGRDLLHDVRDDTSGDYKKILTYLISRV